MIPNQLVSTMLMFSPSAGGLPACYVSGLLVCLQQITTTTTPTNTHDTKSVGLCYVNILPWQITRRLFWSVGLVTTNTKPKLANQFVSSMLMNFPFGNKLTLSITNVPEKVAVKVV